MRRAPGHLLVDPDQQETPLPKRCVVAGPVRRAIAGGRWLAHAPRLTPWIREVNPSSSDFCNNAPRAYRSNGVVCIDADWLHRGGTLADFQVVKSFDRKDIR